MKWTRDELYKLYWTDNLSCVDIAKSAGKDPKTIWYWMKKLNIPTRPRGSDDRQHFKKGHKLCVGRKLTDETKEKLRQARYSDGAKCLFLPNGDHVLKGRTGKNHPSWMGGTSPERNRLYATQEWKDAVKIVWEKANSSCERCGMHHNSTARKYGVTFHIHHIWSFSLYEEKRCDVDNLVLLCEKCHRWVHSRDNVNEEFLKGEHK